MALYLDKNISGDQSQALWVKTQEDPYIFIRFTHINAEECVSNMQFISTHRNLSIRHVQKHIPT